jgi:HEAT repeat protein
MRRFLALGFLLAGASAWAAGKNDPCAEASSTSDVQFELALKDHGSIFRQGEIVALTLSFSSTVKGRYTAMMATYDRSGRLPEEKYCVNPEAPDPLESYFKTRGTMGGGLVSIRSLDETPLTAEAELNEWRSLPLGHYRVYAVSHRVSRPRNANEDTTSANVTETLRSNAIEIEVTAADPAWQAEQLRTAIQTLAGNASQEEARHAARVLRFLNTQDSAREMAKLFWGLNQRQPLGWEYMFGLYGSPYRQIAIDAMRGELAVPDHTITSEFLDTLTNLQVNAEPQWENPPAPNEQNAQEMQAFWLGRRAREQELMKAAITAVLESLPRKTDRARALTLDGLLKATDGNAVLSETVRPALIAAWADLPAETQAELIQYRWPAVAGKDMLPILRKIVAGPPPPAGTQAAMLRMAALRRLYELDLAAGREAIRNDFENDQAQLLLDVVKLLPADYLARAARRAAERIGMGGARELDFELVDHYADESVLPTVRTAFEKMVGSWTCGPQSAMLRYFLRVSPEYGAQQTAAALAKRNVTGCYRTLFEDLGDRLPHAQKVAIEALDDPDPEVARATVTALGRWGSKDAEAVLWDKLKRFHKEWEGRADELRWAPDGKSAGPQGMAMEQALVTAIAAGTNWICPPEKLARLSALVWIKAHQQQIESWVRQWDQAPAVIYPNWIPDHDAAFSVLQYNSLTLEQLVAKVVQLPQGMEVEWQFLPAQQASLEMQDALYEQVRRAAAANGIVVGRGR